MSLSISNPPPTIPQTAAQMLVVPHWMARALASQLRAIAPRGGILPLISVPPPPFDVRAAALSNQFI